MIPGSNEVNKFKEKLLYIDLEYYLFKKKVVFIHFKKMKNKKSSKTGYTVHKYFIIPQLCYQSLRMLCMKLRTKYS